MNFTKEYINECDCPEIQGLKPKLEYADWYAVRGNKGIFMVTVGYNEFSNRYSRKDRVWLPTKDRVWLPTSGQLDEEIVKICKHNLWLYKVVYGLAEDEKEFGYDIEVYNADGLYWHDIAISYNTNPLIAKIKLLKELLNES